LPCLGSTFSVFAISFRLRQKFIEISENQQNKSIFLGDFLGPLHSKNVSIWGLYKFKYFFVYYLLKPYCQIFIELINYVVNWSDNYWSDIYRAGKLFTGHLITGISYKTRRIKEIKRQHLTKNVNIWHIFKKNLKQI